MPPSAAPKPVRRATCASFASPTPEALASLGFPATLPRLPGPEPGRSGLAETGGEMGFERGPLAAAGGLAEQALGGQAADQAAEPGG